MNAKVLGKMLAGVAIAGAVVTATIAPSSACGGRYYKSHFGRNALPQWLGAIALLSIGGAVAGNELMKRASTDEPVG